jgi:hypothetical protein
MTKKLILLEYAKDVGLPPGSSALVYIDGDKPFDPLNPAVVGHVAVFPTGMMPFLLGGLGNELDRQGLLTEKEKLFFGPQGQQLFALVLPPDGDGTTMQEPKPEVPDLIVPPAAPVFITDQPVIH